MLIIIEIWNFYNAISEVFLFILKKQVVSVNNTIIC